MNVKRAVYPILESKIAEKGIAKKDIAQKLGITPRALSKKLKGETNFTLTEGLFIHKLFADIQIEVLFSKEKV